MSALKYFLMLLGAVVFGSAGALVAYDIYLSEQLRQLLSQNKTDESGADLKSGQTRNTLRKSLTLRMNFLGGHAGQGLR
jgi:hypothetical protein